MWSSKTQRLSVIQQNSPDHLKTRLSAEKGTEKKNHIWNIWRINRWWVCSPLSPDRSGWDQQTLHSENKPTKSDKPEFPGEPAFWRLLGADRQTRQTHRSWGEDTHSLDLDFSWDADGVNPLQLQTVFVLQHVTSVYGHLDHRDTRIYFRRDSCPGNRKYDNTSIRGFSNNLMKEDLEKLSWKILFVWHLQVCTRWTKKERNSVFYNNWLPW